MKTKAGKCVRCRAKKGKRDCPALGEGICASCCAEHRQREIACPASCPHLSGENYQAERRQHRWVSRSRPFLDRLRRRLRSKDRFDFALRIYVELYAFSRSHGRVDDSEIADALDGLGRQLGPVILPGPTSDLGEFLRTRFEESEYLSERAVVGDRHGVVNELASLIRTRRTSGHGTLIDELEDAFEGLDLATDLGYDGPVESSAGQRQRGGSPSGLILPPDLS